jgi:hypothetical protein
MSYRDKPWFHPPQYNDPNTEPTRMEPSGNSNQPSDDELNSDDLTADGFDVPRSTGGRDRVKPVGGSKDTSPLHYRRARPDKNEIDLDDNDYIALDSPDQGLSEEYQ